MSTDSAASAQDAEQGDPRDMNYEVLRQLPLLTSVVWSFIAAYQVYRRRTRTTTEITFLLGAASFAGYAAADWAVFNTSSYDTALFLARFSLSAITLAVFFFFLFTKHFLTRPYKTDALFLIPLFAVLGLAWDGIVVGLEGDVPWNWTGIFDPLLFSVWLTFVILCAVGGTWYAYGTYKVVRTGSRFLGLRFLGILTSFLVTLGFGLGTNGVFAVVGVSMMPLFSTLLVIPGIVVVYVLIPFTKERFSTVIRRWKGRRYEVIGAYLIYANGSLIASKTSYVDDSVDHDIFGATLDAIQSFMRTSFPYLLGRSLRRIEHGEVAILIERGRHSYLALVIRGEDNETLWIRMRELVENFEGANLATLPDWNGVPDDLSMVSDTLASCFREEALFS